MKKRDTSKELSGWIGVDLDGTLAHYDGWRGPEHIGQPILPMLNRVKQWISEGRDVRIFTGRVVPCIRYFLPADIPPTGKELLDGFKAMVAIDRWCQLHVGTRLPVTCIKDLNMAELWDDRAVEVVRNIGPRLSTA